MYICWIIKHIAIYHHNEVPRTFVQVYPVNQETSEKSAEISKSWLQVWIPPTKIFKTAKIT